jgi:hypothetical protein
MSSNAAIDVAPRMIGALEFPSVAHAPRAHDRRRIDREHRRRRRRFRASSTIEKVGIDGVLIDRISILRRSRRGIRRRRRQTFGARFFRSYGAPRPPIAKNIFRPFTRGWGARSASPEAFRQHAVDMFRQRRA